MTGEAEPVYRRPGHSVLSGTTIVEGELDIRVRSAFGDSRINQIMLLLESSERNKAAAQKRAESLADRLVPLSLLLFGGLFARTGSLTRAAGVLMVDYSCALRLAMPVNVMTAMIQSSRQKVAVRGGRALEAFAGADLLYIVSGQFVHKRFSLHFRLHFRVKKPKPGNPIQRVLTRLSVSSTSCCAHRVAKVNRT